MENLEKQLIALGMEFCKPFTTLDSTTGKFIETGTMITCFKKTGKDDFNQVYFVVDGDLLFEYIFDETDGYVLNNISSDDIKEYFKHGILIKPSVYYFEL